MDGGTLFASFAFGVVGMGMFMYGRRAERPIALGAGMALMAIPSFLPNLAVQLIVCVALTATPWLLRND